MKDFIQNICSILLNSIGLDVSNTFDSYGNRVGQNKSLANGVLKLDKNGNETSSCRKFRNIYTNHDKYGNINGYIKKQDMVIFFATNLAMKSDI